MISHQTPAPPPLITQPPTPLLPQISRTAFCLNPAKTVSFPHNPTSPDLPGSVWITSPQLPVQTTRTQNVFECPVTNAGESRPPSKDSPSAAAPPSMPPATGDPYGCGHCQAAPHCSLLCLRCQKPGHFAWHCLLGLEVHYLSMVEQEELLLQLLAMKDAAEALLLDEPILELTSEEISACALLPELEGDF
ncbi:hypothetical protein E4T56_gene20257 [Termitomyces sp. T112]|nr:hypothetical protein E4T56_gene20257 [Termitomyces sp. T112]